MWELPLTSCTGWSVPRLTQGSSAPISTVKRGRHHSRSLNAAVAGSQLIVFAPPGTHLINKPGCLDIPTEFVQIASIIWSGSTKQVLAYGT